MSFALSHLRRRIYSCKWACSTLSRRCASSKGVQSSKRLPETPARTRFAPSPTGNLHLGSLRTALFNYLLAKATGGQFLLRIEDTDQKRTIPGAEEKLCEDLQWAGLQWDEGPGVGGPYGPYQQSKRTALYREHAEKLLANRNAYRCFCTPDRLHALAKHRSDLGLPTDYDRTCMHVSHAESDDRAAKGEAHVIRLKVPEVYPEFHDLVYGRVRNRQEKRPLALTNPAFEDPILIKSDGFPTYHLANVVDDHHMKITHVVRAAEWMSSTPKHLAMYKAFGWQPPTFAHVGLLLDQNGQKLSKRNLDIDISTFKNKNGILPEALVNYVALLGWSHGSKNDLMTMQELIENFSTKFTKGNTVVTLDKMWFLQKGHVGRYAKMAESGDTSKMDFLTTQIIHRLQELDVSKVETMSSILAGRSLDAYVKQMLMTGCTRGYTNTEGFVSAMRYFFHTPTEKQLRDGMLNFRVHHVSKEVQERLSDLNQTVSAMQMLEFIPEEQWNLESVREMLISIISTQTNDICEETVAEGDAVDTHAARKAIDKVCSLRVNNYVRWAMLAGDSGPSSAEILTILGMGESLRRFCLAGKVIETSE